MPPVCRTRVSSNSPPLSETLPAQRSLHSRTLWMVCSIKSNMHYGMQLLESLALLPCSAACEVSF